MTDEKWQAREIRLWVVNDESLYQQFMSYRSLFEEKKEKGIFNRALAEKGLMALVDAAISHINRKVPGTLGRVSNEVKETVAEKLMDELWDDYGLKSVRARPARKK